MFPFEPPWATEGGGAGEGVVGPIPLLLCGFGSGF